MASSILLDTNLLVLLVVGSASDRLIATHKRTRAYDIEAFRLLAGIIGSAGRIVTTPHILAETSNLVRQCHGPVRQQLSMQLAVVIEELIEENVAARRVTSSAHFSRLGLTDAAMLALSTQEMTLLTDDLDLYLAGATAGLDCWNFTHLREAAPK